jgi:hypothetical protein
LRCSGSSFSPAACRFNSRMIWFTRRAPQKVRARHVPLRAAGLVVVERRWVYPGAGSGQHQAEPTLAEFGIGNDGS